MPIILTPPGRDGTYGTAVSTLREIEQEVARRVGPFLLHYASHMQSGDPPIPVSTSTAIGVLGLRSSIDLGGLEDRYVLRRGRLRNGTRLPYQDEVAAKPFSTDDRVRLIRNYSPGQGVIEVDRRYTYPCYDGEELEIHHLDPEQELRPAVLGGLRRCWVVHNLDVPTARGNPFGRFDLTDLAPWITTRDQVYDVTFEGGAPMVNWRAVPTPGGISLRIGEWSPGTVLVVNRRAVATMVRPNPWPVSRTAEDIVSASPLASGQIVVAGEDTTDSEQGWEYRAGSPNEGWSDEDEFPVTMDYAAAAGHIECWRTVRPRMTLAAETGMWADQKEAAAEFTRVATVYFDRPRHKDGLPMWPSWWASNSGSDLTNAGF
jgi:hypothetical protein